MAYTVTSPQIGYPIIAGIDAGYLPPSSVSAGTTTTYPTTPAALGSVVKAIDPTYGEGEFIFLAGVASTAVGSVVAYDTATFQTKLAPVGSFKPEPIAVAMAATGAGSFGWYQISGNARAKKTSGLALASNAAVGVLTAGLIAATGSGKEVQGALTVAKATASTLVTLVINRPHMQGRIT